MAGPVVARQLWRICGLSGGGGTGLIVLTTNAIASHVTIRGPVSREKYLGSRTNRKTRARIEGAQSTIPMPMPWLLRIRDPL